MLKLREAAIEAARGGGAVLRRYYGAPGRVTMKPDGAGPVSEADLASQSVILEVLRPTGLPILAEENSRDAGMDARRWIVDPLDGTGNFIRHLPWFCVGSPWRRAMTWNWASFMPLSRTSCLLLSEGRERR